MAAGLMRSMRFEFSLLLLVFSVHFTGAVPPQLVQGDYEFKTGNILGATFDTALISFQFDQDLYLLDAIGCPTGCPNASVPACPVCDYTNTSAGACTDEFINALPPGCSCPNRDAFCNATDFDVLTPTGMDGRKYGFVRMGEYVFYRVVVPTTCTAYKLTVSPFYGNPDLFVSNQVPRPGKYAHQWSAVTIWTIGTATINLCPSFTEFGPGTYVLGIAGAGGDSEFAVWLDAAPALAAPPTNRPPCEVPAWVADYDPYWTYECLQDGVSVTYTYDTEQLGRMVFTETEPGCHRVVVSVAVLSGDTDFFVKFDAPDFGEDDSDADYAAEKDGSDMVAFVLCVDAEKGNASVFFEVECWRAGTFVMTLSTQRTTPAAFMLRPLTALVPYDYAMQVAGATQVVCPYQEVAAYYCWDYAFSCSEYWMTWPASDPVPFWPLPALYNTVADVAKVSTPPPELHSTRNATLPAVPGKFTGVFVTRYALDGADSVEVLPPESLLECEVRFMHMLTNGDGEPVNGSFAIGAALTARAPECRHGDFKKAASEVDRVAARLATGVADSDTLNADLFGLDVLQYSDAWYGCALIIDNFLRPAEPIDNDEVIVVNTTRCFAEPYSAEWTADPCCNPWITWWECCGPREVRVNASIWAAVEGQVRYDGVHKASVKQQCGHPDCAVSTLADYARVRGAGAAACGGGGDDVSSREPFDVQLRRATAFYHACQMQAFGQHFEGRTCVVDTDCSPWPFANATCDSVRGVCNAPLAVQERAFVECVVGNMTTAVADFVARSLNIDPALAGRAGVDVDAARQFVDALLARLAVADCHRVDSLGLPMHSYWRYEPLDLVCAAEFADCAVSLCVDTSCPRPLDTCLHYCFGEWVRYAGAHDADECRAAAACNWNATCTDGMSTTECRQQCVDTTTAEFCGVCDDTEAEHCAAILGVTTPQECAGVAACRLPWGEVRVGISPLQCSQLGECTERCYGNGCSSLWDFDANGHRRPRRQRGQCVDMSTTDEAACDAAGGVWDTALSPPLCRFPDLDMISCDHTWQTCDALNAQQCSACAANGSCPWVRQDALRCFVDQWRECADQSECTSRGGSCSDLPYALNLRAARLIDNAAPVFGSCMHDGYLEEWFVRPIPDCGAEETFAPNGCVDWSTTDPAACLEAYANVSLIDRPAIAWWHTPATNQSECEAATGCWQWLDEPRFSPKSPADCAACGGETLPIWKWNAGQWRAATPATPRWLRRAFQNGTYTWGPTLDFERLWRVISQSFSAFLSVQRKSTALCRLNVVRSPLEQLACDCAVDGGGGGCYGNNREVTVAVGRACYGSTNATTVMSTSTRLTVPADAVSPGDACVAITVREVSALYFKSPPQVQLSFTLVPTEDVASGDYDTVHNSHDAVVGRVVGDGQEISLDGNVAAYVLCVDVRSDLDNGGDSSEFTHPDFAELADKDDYSDLRPLGFSAKKDPETGAICATVRSPRRRQLYVPIMRKAGDWRSVEPAVLSDATVAICYVLATLYLVPIALSLVFVVRILVLRVLWKVVYWVPVFLLFFACIRCAYFYATAAGAIGSDRVAELLLVELPIFLFFTAFSIIIATWVSLLRITTRRTTHIFYKVVAGTNAFLYGVFVLLIVLFATLSFSDSDEDTCGGREPPSTTAEEAEAEAKQTISIVYQSLICAVSVGFALAVFIPGMRIARLLLKRRKKLVFITVMGFVAFLLHSVFFLVLVATGWANAAFTFVFLLVTEIVPASVVFTQLYASKERMMATSSPSSRKGSSGQSNTSNSQLSSSSSRQDSSRLESSTAELDKIEPSGPTGSSA